MVISYTPTIYRGTNATAGFYTVKVVDSANEVTLTTNWCTGNVSGGTIVSYHDFTMLSADGICTRVTYGAPDDTFVEIDRDGWIILDTSQANGRLYWRANGAFHYVNATAGFEVPAGEIDCPVCGKRIKKGDAVAGQINEILSDNARHGLWCHLRCLN